METTDINISELVAENERLKKDNPKLKITPEIISFVKQNVRLHPTIKLWELSKLVDKQFKVKLSDHFIYNILHQSKITRKRLKNKYYPEKKSKNKMI